MEDLCYRFPHLSERIFDQLCDQSLADSQRIGKPFCNYIDQQKFKWLRIIHKHIKNNSNFSKDWKKVVENAPTKIIQDLGKAI